ncbi:MAG: N-6 DNA methylase, partial [Kofleriaceae bacterium]|nr:N-6 DNA methylase [Kofleriaceae bacterium]
MTARRKPAGGGRGRTSARDPMERFHDEWLGMVQPIDGLVVSKPALIDAQVARPDDRTLRERFLAHLTTADPATARIADLPAFLADILDLGPTRWLPSSALPERYRLAIPDTGQLLAPTAALVQDPAAEPVALRWELPPELPLDVRETVTGGWDYPPSAKFDRLLRHAGVPIGLLSNGTHLRLMYAPHGASTGAITFPVGAMARADGRPILDAFVMLLHRTRWFSVKAEHQLPALLAASREAQGRVTRALADQVLEALHVLLAGFEAAQGGASDGALAAAYRDPELGPDHVYAGLLTFMLRLVFVLYAEDNDLLPVDDDLYAEHLSVLALYEELASDAGAYPDAMARRYGAYGRLLSLFRAIYFGVAHGPLRMPPRHGELFSPHVYRFLEGNAEPAAPGPGDPAGRRRLDVPAIDDETVYRVLRGLLMLGDERLSYKALDVEQIGSVYENLMGYRVVELATAAVCLKKSRAWIAGEDLANEPQGARAKWLQDEAGLAKAEAEKAAKATAGAKKADAVLDALLDSGAALAGSRTAAGRFVIQPGAERRRSGSHYTPRSLTAPIVEKTLAPLLAALPRRVAKKGGPAAEGPSSEDLLSLKICDPAMGSGAFLVEAVRQLGDHVVAAWRREGRARDLLPSHGPAHGAEDAVAQARRLVAQRCIYGVDKNPQAVTLAKLSLWLVTLAKDKPFSFVDHALRCGDSLVGLDIDQITAFHWDAGKKGQQLDLIDREIRDVLQEAVDARERIVALAKDDSPEAQAEKLRLLRDAEDAVGRLRMIGDLVLGAFFSSVKEKEREAERVRRRDLVEAWLRSGRAAGGEIVELAAEFRRRIPAFHWMIELPEVFWVERPDPLDGGK